MMYVEFMKSFFLTDSRAQEAEKTLTAITVRVISSSRAQKRLIPTF